MSDDGPGLRPGPFRVRREYASRPVARNGESGYLSETLSAERLGCPIMTKCDRLLTELRFV